PDMARLEARKRRYQRRMARQQKPSRKQGIKPSNRYLKTRKRVQKVSRQIRNIRSDWQHRESRKIADRYQYAAVEDLNARGMTRSAKGSVENPGRNVKAKSGLNREILKTGWSGLRRKLAYKMEVIGVDPKNTSRTCHECGHVDRKSRTTQSRFGCVVCEHSGNADVNAALNILALGTRATGQGGRSGYGPGELSRRYGDVDVVNYSL
ncbi:MAG: transposase, partial [Gammaproteobacteria bacterium]|nr:transposase [Gammaproteobacteria bacterium]